eukprot:7814072-Ditylum_brightwellii.AAC.1
MTMTTTAITEDTAMAMATATITEATTRDCLTTATARTCLTRSCYVNNRDFGDSGCYNQITDTKARL